MFWSELRLTESMLRINAVQSVISVSLFCGPLDSKGYCCLEVVFYPDFLLWK
jgi:hypothetical protein